MPGVSIAWTADSYDPSYKYLPEDSTYEKIVAGDYDHLMNTPVEEDVRYLADLDYSSSPDWQQWLDTHVPDEAWGYLEIDSRDDTVFSAKRVPRGALSLKSRTDSSSATSHRGTCTGG